MKKLLLLLLLGIPLTDAYAEECVVLLHGLARSTHSFHKTETHLSNQYYRVLNIGYPSTQHSIHELSEIAVAESITQANDLECETIHFVTHSLGGMLVRDYLANHTIENLGRVVMLGPPNKGSEVVDYIGDWKLFEWINGPAGQELGTDSLSVPNLLGSADFELGVIAGDRSINWMNSLMIDGPDDGKVSVERSKIEGMSDHITLHTTHTFMMKKKEVLNQITYFLEHGFFEKEQTN